MDRMTELVRKLAGVYGPSGGEEHVRKLIKKEIRPFVDKITVDSFGNLIARQNGRGPRVLIFAHMDEIGLMVKGIEDNGRIIFSRIGGIEPETLLAQQVHIVASKNKIVHGVISSKNLHEGLVTEEFPSVEQMYIDIGLNSRKEVKKLGIGAGDYVVPRRAFATLGKENIVSGKAMDNRVGCAAAIELARKMRKKKRNISYVFTAQEEMGMYGARVSAFALEGDFAINVDTTPAQDHGKTGKGMSNGPYLTYKDEEFIANTVLMKKVERLLKKKKIGYQIEVSDTGTTDALAISLSKGGMPTIVISIPVRNIHSTISIADINDVKGTVKAIEAIATDPPV
ncbi:M42 family metallopeptidase [archaeon]